MIALPLLLTLAALAAPAGASECPPETAEVPASFSDMPCFYDGFEAVEWLTERGVVQGRPDGLFHPADGVNRAEMAKMVMMLNYPEEVEGCAETEGAPFPDVDPEAWYGDVVCAAARRGLVHGYPDGLFRPEQQVSFVEAAKIIVNASGTAREASSPGDEWFASSVDALAGKRAIPISIVRFDQPLSREETVLLLYRLQTEGDWPTHTRTDIAALQTDPMAFYLSKLGDRGYVGRYGGGHWWQAVEALGTMGKPALDGLVDHLDTRDAFEQDQALQGLLLAAQTAGFASDTLPQDTGDQETLAQAWRDWYAAHEPSQTRTLKLYLLALGDDGQRGERVGCGDSLVPVTAIVSRSPAVLHDAVAALLAVDNVNELENTIGLSTLRINSIDLTRGIATLRLDGQMNLRGECDDPRVLGQLTATAQQFPSVTRVRVFVNGCLFDGSLRDDECVED